MNHDLKAYLYDISEADFFFHASLVTSDETQIGITDGADY